MYLEPASIAIYNRNKFVVTFVVATWLPMPHSSYKASHPRPLPTDYPVPDKRVLTGTTQVGDQSLIFWDALDLSIRRSVMNGCPNPAPAGRPILRAIN